jgi:hypothetical protein
VKKLVVAVLVLVGLVLWLLPRREPARDGLDMQPEAPLVAAPAPLETPQVVAAEPEASTAREPVAEPAAATPSEPEETALSGTRAEFHGQLLDALSQRPIAGARVLVSRAQRKARADELTPEEIAREVHSDADGFFVLPVSTRGGGEPGHVLAEGFGARRFLADGAHGSRAQAAVLALVPAAGLEVRVRETGGAPAAGARVELVRPGEHFSSGNSAMFLTGLSWSALADDAGLARFAGLPAEIELAWSVRHADGEGGPAGRLALAPGETRRLEVVLGGARLVGHVRDEQGVPVPGLALWLAQADVAAHDREVVATASSDANGRFEFAAVPFARLVLGPDPELGGFVVRAEALVVVDRPVVEQDLEVTPGLFLEGRVVGSAAELARISFLNVFRLDGTWCAGGEFLPPDFRAGPLPSDEYLVSASGADAATTRVRAAAGTSGIELELLGARELVLRIQGAGGPCELAFREPSTSIVRRSHVAGEVRQRFAFGEHVVQATTADGRVGMLAFTVDELTPEELVLALAPGASCTFVHRAEAGARTLVLRVDGAIFALPFRTKALAAGAALEVLVPARPLVVELCEGGRVVASQALAPAAGERLRVELVPAGAR